MAKIKSIANGALFLMILVVLTSSDKPKLSKIKVNQDLTIYVPNTWRAMDAMDFSQRYPSVRAPLAAYTSEDRMVDFSVNVSATQWPDANVEISKQFFKASLMNMFDRVEIIKEGVHEINKKKFAFFEFNSRVNGNKKDEGTQDPVLRYTYIQYLVEPGRTLVFSFNCPQRMQEDWQATAREMMNKVKVR
jgi:hypothetical protein